MSTNTPSASRAARRLNEHHERRMAGFYGGSADIAGRYFGARVHHGQLQVTPDARSTWVTVDLAKHSFHDHNGRTIHL